MAKAKKETKKPKAVEVKVPVINVQIPVADAVIRNSTMVATTTLTVEQRAGLFALLEGLRKTNKVLDSGQAVNCLNTTVKWMLEQIPVTIAAEGDKRIAKVSQ